MVLKRPIGCTIWGAQVGRVLKPPGRRSQQARQLWSPKFFGGRQSSQSHRQLWAARWAGRPLASNPLGRPLACCGGWEAGLSGPLVLKVASEKQLKGSLEGA